MLDLYSFGWYNHDLAAMVLYDSIVEVARYYQPARPEGHQPLVEQDRSQQILRAKIYAEFIALLEVFGVLCVTIRERKRKSMIWTFLNTEPSEVSQFYEQVLSYDKAPSLTRLLKFPSQSQIHKAAAQHPEMSLAESEELDKNYEVFSQNIKIIAELYRDNSNANV